VPQYQIKLHPTAQKELDSLLENEKENITDAIKSVAKTECPSTHSAVKHLDGTQGLFRVRAGRVRAIAVLDKPTLRILKVGKRDTVYRYIDDIEERLPA